MSHVLVMANSSCWVRGVTHVPKLQFLRIRGIGRRGYFGAKWAQISPGMVIVEYHETPSKASGFKITWRFMGC